MEASGIFFIAYQERFRSSASQTSLILTIQNMTMSFTGISRNLYTLPSFFRDISFILIPYQKSVSSLL